MGLYESTKLNDYINTMNTYTLPQVLNEVTVIGDSLKGTFAQYNVMFEYGMFVSLLMTSFAADKVLHFNEVEVLESLFSTCGIKISRDDILKCKRKVKKAITQDKILKVAEKISSSERLELAKLLAAMSRIGDGVISPDEKAFIFKVLS